MLTVGKLETLDYRAAITIILLLLDVGTRVYIANFVQPIYFDGLVGLALGWWFGTSEKKEH